MFESNHRSSSENSSSELVRKPSKKKKKAAEDPLYSPKKAASAIGVSESSLKRWCDAGVVTAVKTAGGHRRISRSEVVAFAKKKNYHLRDPHSIGLPDIHSVDFESVDQARSSFVRELLAANTVDSKKILCSLFIKGHNVAEIFDRVIAPAFSEIGSRWKSGEIEIYRERMATQTCHEALLELRTIIPQVSPNAPIAIGAALEGNEFQLATLGVELCLRNFGWSATSLGANIPINSLLQAATDLKPSFIWISATMIDDPASFVSRLNSFAESVTDATKVVVGGRAIGKEILEHISNAHYCENFAQLVMLARIPEANTGQELNRQN